MIELGTSLKARILLYKSRRGTQRLSGCSIENISLDRSDLAFPNECWLARFPDNPIQTWMPPHAPCAC